MEFSFAKDTGYVLVKHLSSLLSTGVDIYSYYYSEDNNIYRTEYKNGIFSYFKIIEDEELSKIVNLRQPKKIEYSWELNQEIIQNITNQNKENFQFSIQSEEQRLILSLRFNNPFDGLNDIVFIMFRQDLGFIGIDLSKLSLNTDNKKLIANLLYKSCITALNTASNDKIEFRKFTDKTKTAIDTIKIYKDRFEQLSKEHHNNVINVANSIIHKLSQKYSCNFILTDQCIESLKGYSSDLQRLQTITESAALYAYNLNYSSKNSLIAIEAEYLLLTDSDVLKTEHLQNKDNTKKQANIEKIDKVEAYLNRLESSVKKCLANKLKPIGNNVANFMEPIVTSAALTVYLKKNSDEVNEILDKDLSLFPQIRKHFKPLQNVLYYNPKDVRSTG